MSVVHRIGRMFNSKEMLLLPHRWGWYFLGGGEGLGCAQTKETFREMYEAWNFQRGEVGGVP